MLYNDYWFCNTFFLKKKGKTFNFNVVSIKGESFNLGVKYGNEIVPLTATHFPCMYMIKK